MATSLTDTDIHSTDDSSSSTDSESEDYAFEEYTPPPAGGNDSRLSVEVSWALHITETGGIWLAQRLTSVFYDYCTHRAVPQGLSQNSQARSEPSTRRSTEEDTDLRAESLRAKQLSGACLAGVDGTKLQSSSLNDSYIRGPHSAAFRRLAYANYIGTYDAGSLNDVTCHTHDYIINNILYYIS